MYEKQNNYFIIIIKLKKIIGKLPNVTQRDQNVIGRAPKKIYLKRNFESWRKNMKTGNFKISTRYIQVYMY